MVGSLYRARLFSGLNGSEICVRSILYVLIYFINMSHHLKYDDFHILNQRKTQKTNVGHIESIPNTLTRKKNSTRIRT